MSILVMLAFTLAMILWTILNWRHEIDYIKEAYAQKQWKHVFRGVTNFGLDTVITTGATTLLGLSGFYAAGLAIFFSNMISLIFFSPPRSWRDQQKSHQRMA